MVDELYEEVVYGDEYEKVTGKTVTDTSRWHTFYEQVFKKISDNTFWELSWRQGSTEYQNEGPEDVELVEVVPTEVTVIKYIRKTS